MCSGGVYELVFEFLRERALKKIRVVLRSRRRRKVSRRAGLALGGAAGEAKAAMRLKGEHRARSSFTLGGAAESEGGRSGRAG